jgi:hypothetical protein
MAGIFLAWAVVGLGQANRSAPRPCAMNKQASLTLRVSIVRAWSLGIWSLIFVPRNSLARASG